MRKSIIPLAIVVMAKGLGSNLLFDIILLNILRQLQNHGHGQLQTAQSTNRVPPFLRPLGVEGLACQDRFGLL